jgi:glycosyltransferase involved in cell wall biosynthesis
MPQKLPENSMSISIIVPVHNASTTLEVAVVSALKLGVDLEIIVVDDYSSDDTVRVAKELQRRFQGLSVIEFSSNRGVSSARNAGINAATKHWITFLDADDAIYIDDISRAFLTNYKDPVTDLIIFNHINSNISSPPECYGLCAGNLDKHHLKLLAAAYLRNPTGHSIITHCWGKIYRRSFLLYNLIRFKDDLLIYEDTEFVGKCLIFAQQAIFVTGNLYYYRSSTGLSRHFEKMPLGFIPAVNNFSKLAGDNALAAQASGVFIARTLSLTRNLAIKRRYYLIQLISTQTNNSLLDSNGIKSRVLKLIVRTRLWRKPLLCTILLSVFYSRSSSPGLPWGLPGAP